jgi:hypothetical protein
MMTRIGMQIIDAEINKQETSATRSDIKIKNERDEEKLAMPFMYG